MNNRELIKKSVADTVLKLYQPAMGVLAKISVSYPPQESVGDYTTNAPLILAKELGKNPLAMAEEIKSKFPKNDLIAEVAIAKPGFLNFRLATAVVQKTVGDVLENGQKYGEIKQDKPLKIQVEFVSANPTGPLHIGNFRGGPLGDSLARVLAKAGHKVEREYYHNDVGNQVRHLGESILWWVNKLNGGDPGEFPEDGYKGGYVEEYVKSKLPELKEELTKFSDQKFIKDLFVTWAGK